MCSSDGVGPRGVPWFSDEAEVALGVAWLASELFDCVCKCACVCATEDVPMVRGLLSRLSRCAPLPSRATFRRDPLRRRVRLCWEEMAVAVAMADRAGERMDDVRWLALRSCFPSGARTESEDERIKGMRERMLWPGPPLR